MNEKRARELLGNAIESDDGLDTLGLSNTSGYVNWQSDDDEISLDGNFSSEELEAILWWMQNKRKHGKR